MQRPGAIYVDGQRGARVGSPIKLVYRLNRADGSFLPAGDRLLRPADFNGALKVGALLVPIYLKPIAAGF